MSNISLPILFGVPCLVCFWVNLWASVPINYYLLEIAINWDAISAIGESLGAVAVVVSLVYLGRQLSHNTEMIRVAVATETLEIDHTIILPIIESEEFAEIWLKGDHRLNELSEANMQRLLIFERRAFTLWHHNFQLRSQKFVSDDTWYYQNGMIQFLSHREAVRQAWSIFKVTYEPPFQEYVDEQFRIARDALRE
jgi:hypothetical protein